MAILSTREKVRLLIKDRNPALLIFSDDEIDSFLDIENGNIKKAAALAAISIATSEVYIQKRIKALDLQTDGPAEAEALLKLAKEYRAQGQEEEAALGGAIDFAEMVLDPFSARERLVKEIQRDC